MTDEPDPPRKFYKLKEAEFERVNAPLRATATTKSVDLPQIIRGANDLPDNGSGPVADAPVPATNDVHAILRDNLDRANAAGLNDLAPKAKRPSKRKRDYWTLLLLGNGLFSGALPIVGLATIGGICVFAGMIFFTTSLTWIMWGVMDDY